MLTFLSLVWGIASVFGILVGYLPWLRNWHWLNLPFDVAGAVVGIVAIFHRKGGGSRWAVIGTTLCMLSAIVAMVTLVMRQDPS